MRTDRPGIALLVVVLLTLVVSAMAAGAALIGANSYLVNEYDRKSSLLALAADAGLELGRARLNADPSLYDDRRLTPLEVDAATYDAEGAPIRGITRSVYVMPLGGGPGQHGDLAALVAIAEDGTGARAVRRLDLVQETFARYAYFTEVEPEYMTFSHGDALYGPVHSNDDIRIGSSGATFHGPTTTAGELVGADHAVFLGDTASGVQPIPMPTPAELGRLRERAAPAHLAFISPGGGGEGQAGLRLEFVARDVDRDGIPEGFVRAYRSSDVAWVTANMTDSLAATPNCGHLEPNGRFHQARQDPKPGHTSRYVLESATRRCFLGGAEELNGSDEDPRPHFVPLDARGEWIRYPGAIHADVAGEPDADYLFPLDRRFNPSFRGVIHVEGKVVVSGTVRGRLTLAASGDIIIGDDLVYDTDPGGATCTDLLGLFSGRRVLVADNTINAPRRSPGTVTFFSYDETPDENIHASILALDRFGVQNPLTGAASAEPCNGTPWGRGCLNLTGGLIQHTRGIVAGSGGTGNIKRYTHDTCAFTAPPPYFPTTGHFYRGRYYAVDPTGFDIDAYFDALN